MSKNYRKYIDIANRAFIEYRYDEAELYFTLATRERPRSYEAELGTRSVFLLDLDEFQARMIFEFFHATKLISPKEAILMSRALLDSAEMSDFYLEDDESFEEFDGISYSDLARLADHNKSFKAVFDKVIHSTKVYIEEKEEFYELLDQLITNDYKELALVLIDNVASAYPADEKIGEFLTKIGTKNHENSNRQQ